MKNKAIPFTVAYVQQNTALKMEISAIFKWLSGACQFLPQLLLVIVSCSHKGAVNDPAPYIYIQNEDKDSTSWKLVWQDNFDGAELDSGNWARVPQGSSNWNDQMTDKDDRCFAMKNGKLHLKGIRNVDNPADTRPYLTGGIHSKGKFAFQYGRIEIRARLGSAQGAWPAIWMMPEKMIYGGWPKGGEIDIMEHLNFDDFVYQTIHSSYTQELNRKDNPPHYGKAAVKPGVFNTYALEWYLDKLVFMLNGKVTFTYPKIEGADSVQWPFDQQFYIIISQQLGGNWVGEVDLDHLPVDMVVDWVRVYQ